MPKPNSSWTLKQIKDYVRSHKINKPEVRLGMRKPELIAGLKKHGHWEGTTTVTKSEFTKARRGLRKAVPKKKVVKGVQKKLGTKVKGTTKGEVRKTARRAYEGGHLKSA